MKRLIANNDDIPCIIDITMELEEVANELYDDINSRIIGSYLHNRGYDLPQDIFDTMEYVIDYIIKQINKYNFQIIKQYQSPYYSYYIDFWCLDENGNKLSPYKIKFRISDHKAKMNPDPNVKPKEYRIKSFKINRLIVNDVKSLTDQIDWLFVQLEQGNVDTIQ